MSKLIEQLENIGKGTPQPIGFRAVHTEKNKSHMALIASVAEDVKKIKDYLSGADAVLLPANVKTQALTDIAVGRLLTDTGEKAIGAVTESGADFVVFAADTTIFTLEKDSKLGRILRIDTSLSDSLLRTVGELPVDAVLVESGKKDSFTWNDLMALQRFVAGKPLLVAVTADLTPDELKAIWNAGADGIVVSIGAETPADTMAELHKEITKLAPRAKKRGKTEVMLPFAGAKSEPEPEPEHEEEEDE